MSNLIMFSEKNKPATEASYKGSFDGHTTRPFPTSKARTALSPAIDSAIMYAISGEAQGLRLDGSSVLSRKGIGYSLLTMPAVDEILERLAATGNHIAINALESLGLLAPDPDNTIVTIAQSEDHIAGVALATINDEQARVERVAVAPQHQGRGIATTMGRALLLPYLRNRGVRGVDGQPIRGRETFYQQFGATDDGNGEMSLRIA